MPRCRVPQARAATCNPPCNAPCNAPPCSAPLQRAPASLVRQSCEEGASGSRLPSPAPYLTPTLLLPLLLPFTPTLLLPHSYLTRTLFPPHLPPACLTHLLLISPVSSLPHLTYLLLASPASFSPHLPPPHLTYLLLTRWATLCSAELEWISQLEIAQLEISQLEISQLEGAEGAAAGLGAGSS